MHYYNVMKTGNHLIESPLNIDGKLSKLSQNIEDFREKLRNKNMEI